MKKITFLAVAILVAGNAAKASGIINFSDYSNFPVSVYDAEPISFTERGIEFFIFPDGQFDFNTQPSSGQLYYKNGRRSGNVNATYGAPANYNDGGVKVEHDANGKVRRVGNVFINYDANDRIKRIGSVYMSYNRFALSQVGGMSIFYNQRGQITGFAGAVKGGSRIYQTGGNGYNNDYYSPNTGSGNNTSDYYYYKPDGTKAKIEEKTSDKK